MHPGLSEEVAVFCCSMFSELKIATPPKKIKTKPQTPLTTQIHFQQQSKQNANLHPLSPKLNSPGATVPCHPTTPDATPQMQVIMTLQTEHGFIIICCDMPPIREPCISYLLMTGMFAG